MYHLFRVATRILPWIPRRLTYALGNVLGLHSLAICKKSEEAGNEKYNSCAWCIGTRDSRGPKKAAANSARHVRNLMCAITLSYLLFGLCHLKKSCATCMLQGMNIFARLWHRAKGVIIVGHTRDHLTFSSSIWASKDMT